MPFPDSYVNCCVVRDVLSLPCLLP